MIASESIFEKHPRFIGGLLLAISIVLLDLLAGKLLIPDNFQSFRIRHSYYHHAIEPNQETISNWGQKFYAFNSNSLGFRDSCVQKIPLKSEKRRILFLGDSHTEAVGINFEDSFVGRLARATAASGIEILNASAVSYSPKIHYLKSKFLIEQTGLDFDELYIIIDMSDLNNEIAYESFQPHKESALHAKLASVSRKLSSYSATIYLADRLVKNRRNRFFRDHMASAENENFELYATFFSEFKDADLLNNPNFHHVSQWLDDEKFKDLAVYSLELGQSNILLLKELCDQHGIKLTISVHPWPEQILKGDTTNLYVDSWRDFASGADIAFINLFPVFINETNPLMTARQCYIHEDNHWNENGHEKVFKRFMEEIMKEGEQ